MKPIERVFCERRLRAAGLGRYPSCAAAARTLSTASEERRAGRSLRIRLTDVFDIPDSRATSASVGREPHACFLLLPWVELILMLLSVNDESI